MRRLGEKGKRRGKRREGTRYTRPKAFIRLILSWIKYVSSYRSSSYTHQKRANSPLQEPYYKRLKPYISPTPRPGLCISNLRHRAFSLRRENSAFPRRGHRPGSLVYLWWRRLTDLILDPPLGKSSGAGATTSRSLVRRPDYPPRSTLETFLKKFPMWNP